MFLTANARRAFTKLRQVFIEALILNNFDLERHIQIVIDASIYTISKVFSQLTLDNSSQWHPIIFFSKKTILVKTWYETHDKELLAIIGAFKTWKHYLKGGKHEVFVLTNHNNL